MEENVQTKAGQGMGIAGFVLGLIALIISFVPCLGAFAIYPGILAIVLSAVAMYQASKGNGAKGLIIAALVVSIVGTGIAAWQYMVLKEAANQIEKGIEEGLNNPEFKDAMNEFKEAAEEMKEAAEEMEDAEGGDDMDDSSEEEMEESTEE